MLTSSEPVTDPRRRGEPLAVFDVIEELAAAGRLETRVNPSAIPTGFDVLDRVLDGGIRLHDLVLLGGLPGVGKTIASIQMAREVALAGYTAVYVCYEHDARTLFGRLLSLELGAEAGDADLPHLELLRGSVLKTINEGGDFRTLVVREPQLAAALERIAAYAHRLILVAASGAHTGLPELNSLVRERLGDGGVLFVDYLQKVAVKPEPPDEAEKVTKITEGLKELALSHDVRVVAIVAADRAALDTRRLRLHHLRGSSALAYEADAIVLLNDKFNCVSKVHLAYDAVRAETFHRWVVFTVEKNRGGPALVDLEFRKEFAFYRFDPRGGYVAERLVDERLVLE